ncbi:hypothetical protein Lser_V15G22402 [Lactuca serriola]
MDAIKALSSFQVDVKIMSAKNIQVSNSKDYLFVRCYLSVGNNKRVRLESHAISPNEKISWNESFSLDCIATQSIDAIIQGTVVFELRSRSSKTPLLHKFIGGNANVRGSQLVGRGEVSWRSVFESQNMEGERWLLMRSKKADIKAPSICVSMKIQNPLVKNETKSTKTFGKLKNKRDESCGCSHGHCCETSCIDSELFAIGFALDAF